jgi:CheY-like chemotaxis protein
MTRNSPILRRSAHSHPARGIRVSRDVLLKPNCLSCPQRRGHDLLIATRAQDVPKPVTLSPHNECMTLLCIDDDLDDIEIFREAVKEIDSTYTCIIATSGREGLDLLKKINPDFIFLDINMPLMNGKDTLRYIRAQAHLNAVPVCMFSTYIDDSDQAMYIRLGATRCLIKPRSFSALCRMLENLFEQGNSKFNIQNSKLG